MIRTLGDVLFAIVHREERIKLMVEKNLPDRVIQFERDVVISLKEEYHSRIARLNVYMGIG